MKRFVQVVRNNIVMIPIGSLIGLLALLLVHLLPVQPMQEHVYWSMDMIEKEFTDEILVEGYRATLTGNFTDCLMLEHAVYTNPDHSILEQVLQMYRGETFYAENDPDGWRPGQSLMDYLSGFDQPREVTYSRYWHGYLVLLKPLLLLTSVNTLRLINAAVQLILLGFVLISMSKRGHDFLAKAFLVSIPFLFFISTFSSLSLSICLYIMLAALLCQFKWDDRLEKTGKYMEFFLIVGMATSYFDFLTYPLVTLGYPLCVYLYLHGDKSMQNIKKLCFYSIQWGIGYCGMWAMKWLYADLLSDGSTIKDAFATIFIRTQSVENATRVGGFFSVIGKNLAPYSNWCYFMLAFLIGILCLMDAIKTGIKNLASESRKAIVFFIIALYPFAWYLVMQNHSDQHWQFTCRILALTVFAGTAGMGRLLKKD